MHALFKSSKYCYQEKNLLKKWSIVGMDFVYKKKSDFKHILKFLIHYDASKKEEPVIYLSKCLVSTAKHES